MFTSYPSDYSSLQSELIYYISNSSGGDITIYVTDEKTDEVYGVKKFYSTTSAQLNVAPIVRPHAYPQAEKFVTGFATGTNYGASTIRLSDDQGNTTPTCVVTLSHQMESDLGLVSTFAAEDRALILGECDVVRFRVEPNENIYVYVRQYLYGQTSAAGTLTYTLLDGTIDGFVNFNVAAKVFTSLAGRESELESITVDVAQSSGLVGSVSYTLIDPPKEPIRLMWISSRGSIESYTFPLVKERLRTRNSGESLRTTLTLGSAYETAEVREALAEIIDSPYTWIVLESEYREVLSVSSSVVMSPTEELASIEMVVTYEEA